MGYSYDQWLANQKKAGQSMLDNQRKAINANYDAQIKNTEAEYNSLMQDTRASYEDYYKKNELQKIINERQLAERMANAGLTDSGLNRSSMTGISLSYANQNYKLDTQKQKALDEQSAALAKAVLQLRSARDNELYTANANWENQMQSNAATLYNKQVDSDTEIQKARISAAAKVAASKKSDTESDDKYDWWQYTKNLGSTYTFYNKTTGDTKEFKQGINPYTGRSIEGYSQAELEQGVWNGYQPKLIKYNGNAVEKVSGKNAVGKIDYQGHDKNIFQTDKYESVKDGNTVYQVNQWVWDDDGYYVPVITKNGQTYVLR